MSAMVACSKDDDNSGNNSGDGKTDPSAIAADNLIAYFPLDAAENPAIGTGITYASKGDNATFVAGQRGKAYQGHETDGQLVFNVASNNQLTAAKEYTLSFWLKAPKSNAARAIFYLNKGDASMGSLGLFTDNSNNFIGDSINIKSYLYNTTAAWKGQDYVSHAYLADTWTHVVVLYRKSTSTIELYANGTQLASNVRYSAPDPDGDGPEAQPLLGDLTLDASDKLYFGLWPEDGEAQDWKKSFAVSVDEFRVYNKALTEDEIDKLYKAELVATAE
jgi:hypothetical protein